MPGPSRAIFGLACPVIIFLAGLVLLTGETFAQAEIAPAKSPSAPLDELRKTFTIEGKPVPPEVFRDMGDGDMADSGGIIVTIDVKAAIGSNLYFDDIKANGDWFTQTHKRAGGDLTEESSYRFIGTTENKLLVVIASYSGGGSGVFYTLHILDAQAGRGFDLEGRLYDRRCSCRRSTQTHNRHAQSRTAINSKINALRFRNRPAASSKSKRAPRKEPLIWRLSRRRFYQHQRWQE
jgi:hypothetical protein